LERLRTYRSRMGAALVASRIFTIGTAQKTAVLASGVSYVDSSQIMGELDRQAVEATFSRGK
jgi:hypothetical protein